MRVLLVEDDVMIGESLREALRGQGFAADWVRDGRAADAKSIMLSGVRSRRSPFLCRRLCLYLLCVPGSLAPRTPPHRAG